MIAAHSLYEQRKHNVGYYTTLTTVSGNIKTPDCSGVPTLIAGEKSGKKVWSQ
jgi:hypothetical protein